MDESKTIQAGTRIHERLPEETDMPMMQASLITDVASTLTCPNCGAANESTSLFCEHCGMRLRDFRCPHCGATLDEPADFCERCHQYIDNEHCSFCHALMGNDDQFCPECGSPRAGIECPVCHSLGRFGFCEACGTPLTDSARMALRETWEGQPLTEQLHQLEDELERLWMLRPVTSEVQREKLEAVQTLSARVKKLIAQELAKVAEANGEQTATAAKAEEMVASNRQMLSAEDLKQKIQETQSALQNMLDAMATAEQANPAIARNCAMARKPRVSRLAWKCNYKQALHSSPLGCACPQHGGKWIILDGRNSITDDPR